MTLSGIARRHWTQIAAGWLVQSSKPITSAQIVEARHIAALAGLTIETRNEQRSLVAMRLGAAAAGVLLALGVLAMTVGLIRREAANDLRILVAAGAASSVRRMLTAATAGGLALGRCARPGGRVPGACRRIPRAPRDAESRPGPHPHGRRALHPGSRVPGRLAACRSPAKWHCQKCHGLSV